MSALIRLEGLAVDRGGVPVIEGVSLSLHTGQALILRGPNGIGKTTLLRTVAGLQPPRAGRVIAAPDAVAYAGHADGLKAALTVLENLRFWSAVFGTDAGAVDHAVGAMNLAGLVARPAAALSAGQKRRLGLARLLVTGRPVWVLDEPTVSLDTASVALFAAAVGAHLGQGGAALMATHIDLGLPQAEVLDLTPYRARPPEMGGIKGAFDEAFL